MKKISRNIFLFIIFCLLLSFTFDIYTNNKVFKENHYNEVIDTPPIYGEEPIVDGGVYFIVPLNNNNKCLDIPNSNYSAGTNAIIYDCYGSSNQRFVIEKSYGNYFRIRPLECNNLYLGIDYGQNSTNNLKLFSDTNYDEERLLCDRFIFVYNVNLDSFIISTAISDDTKYIHPVNNNLSNNNYLEQANLVPNNAMYFYWKLVKTNTLALNVLYSEYVFPNETKVFYFHAQYDNFYKIKSSHAGNETMLLEIYEDSQLHTLIYSSQSTYNSVTCLSTCLAYFNALKNTFVEVRISNSSSVPLSIDFYLYCDNQIVISTMVSFVIPDILHIINPSFTSVDCVSIFSYLQNDFEDIGLYPLIQVNMKGTNLKSDDVRGRKLIDSPMFFEIIHGYPGGIEFYDGSNFSNDYLTVSNLPNLSHVNLAFFGSCDSDVEPIDQLGNPISNSLARQAVENGAQYSIGFRGTVLLWGMFSFVTEFFENYANTNNIFEAACYAQEETINAWDFILNIPNVDIDGTKYGTLYIKVLNNIIRYDLNSQTILNRSHDTYENGENKHFYYHNNKQYLIYSNMCTNLDYNNPNSSSIVENLIAENQSNFLIEPNLLINKENEFLFFYFDNISQYCFNCLSGDCINPLDVAMLYRDSLC